MQKIEDEFVEKLFGKTEGEGESDDVLLIQPEETPEMKKARANVARILEDMMKRQQEELNANKFDVREVQKSWELNVGDAKVTDNYLSKFDASDYYKIRLNNFEGPLDLLLYLIKDSKLEIENIKLASITEQYLDYMKDINKVDMEKAAEFIEVAATLVEIKSKAMIPQEQEKAQDENDPEWLLLQRLKEYKLYKEASEKMKTQEIPNRMYKLPDEKVNDFRNVLTQMNIEGLISAFTNLMSKAAVREVVKEERTIVKDRWTVEEKIFEIKTILSTCEKIKFDEMVGEDFTRGEVITLFMAMLELLKLQVINVKQDEMFGDIEIIKGENFNG
jgi:segregation and condensation protein A